MEKGLEEFVTPIKVSDEFKSIYANFNVGSQEEQMRALTKRELYLLLLICLDYHSDEDPVCINNYKSFKDEISKILVIQDDKESDDDIILGLVEETGDKYINIDNIVDMDGNKLADPLDMLEVRDAKIENLLEESEIDKLRRQVKKNMK